MLTISSKLGFVDSFQFFSSSLVSLVKNLGKDDFKYLSQEFDNVSDLVKRKGFYPYEYMNDFEKPKELPSTEKFLIFLTDREYEHVFKFGINLK